MERYYKITCISVEWVKANSEKEAREKWLCEDTVGCADDDIKIEVDNDF